MAASKFQKAAIRGYLLNGMKPFEIVPITYSNITTILKVKKQLINLLFKIVLKC